MSVDFPTQEVATVDTPLQPSPASPATLSVVPRQRRDRSLSRREQQKKDAKEAEEILTQYYINGVYTFPTSGTRVEVTELNESSWQRFFIFGEEPIPPPLPPMIKIKDRRGRDMLTHNYEDENYLKAVDVYERHNDNVRQKQVGDMMRYVYSKGAKVDIPQEWLDEFDDSLPPGREISHVDKLYAFLTEQAYSEPEIIALTVSICGRNPLGWNPGDDDDNEDEGTQ